MTARPTVTSTHFGNVDTAALEHLGSTYDTRGLLDAVDIVDQVGGELTGPDGLRDTLLSIHGMAHALLNGASSTPSRYEDTLPEQVLGALELIDDFMEQLAHVRELLEPLEALRPDGGPEED